MGTSLSCPEYGRGKHGSDDEDDIDDRIPDEEPDVDTENPANPEVIKCFICGGPNVGKTSVFNRILGNYYEAPEASKNLANIGSKMLEIEGFQPRTVCVWDLPSRSRSHLRSVYPIQDAAAAIIVFSVDDDESKQEAKEWYRMIQREIPNMYCIFLANKVDILQNERSIGDATRMVDLGMGQWCKKQGMHCAHASAKANEISMVVYRGESAESMWFPSLIRVVIEQVTLIGTSFTTITSLNLPTRDRAGDADQDRRLRRARAGPDAGDHADAAAAR